MKPDALRTVLADHRRWVETGGKGGVRANLGWANLDGADLRWADLRWAAKGIVSCGPVGASGRLLYAVDHGDTVMIQAGCWWGSSDDLLARIAPGGDHGWMPEDEGGNRREYEAAVAWLVAAIEARRNRSGGGRVVTAPETYEGEDTPEPPATPEPVETTDVVALAAAVADPGLRVEMWSRGSGRWVPSSLRSAAEFEWVAINRGYRYRIVTVEGGAR